MSTPYNAVGGTVTLPLSTIKVTGGSCEKALKKLSDITGPGDNGVSVFHEGNVRYGFSLRGIYIQGSPATETLNESIRGSAVISLGNGESWSGTIIIQQLRANADWGPGGDIGVVLQGVFTGAVTIAQPE